MEEGEGGGGVGGDLKVTFSISEEGLSNSVYQLDFTVLNALRTFYSPKRSPYFPVALFIL